MRRAAALAANLALAFTSLVVVLGALEAVARLTEEKAGAPVAALYTEYDPLLGWRHRPGARREFHQGAYAINSLGLRDRERRYEPPSGTRRVLVLGDSFAEGFSVSSEDMVSHVLERDLSAPECPVEVINGGTVAYSTDQEYLFYREEGARYHAAVVVLLFFYNDVLSNISDVAGEAPKPLLSCEGGPPRLMNDPVPTPPPASTRLRGRPPYPWGSAALEWARKRLGAAPRAYGALAALGLWPPLQAAPPPLETRVYERRPVRRVIVAWSCTNGLLQALNDEVKAHGARLLAVYVPSKMEISERDWGLTRQQYGVDDTVWDRGQVARTLARAGESIGFPVLDLTRALRDVDSSLLGGPYYTHGGHWNALGHRVAARSIARFLRERRWLEPCSAGIILPRRPTAADDRE